MYVTKDNRWNGVKLFISGQHQEATQGQHYDFFQKGKQCISEHKPFLCGS